MMYAGRASCTTSMASVGQVFPCEGGALLLQFAATAPTRVALMVAAGGEYDETITFDVIGRVAFTVAASNLSISARSATGTSVLSWVATPVASWAPARLSYNVLLDAGTYDSDTSPDLAPPAGASAIQIIPRSPADAFTVELKDTATTSAVYDRTDQPQTPIPLGRASRVLLTCAGAVRVVYSIAT